MAPDTDYSQGFYDLIAPGCRASAAVVVPHLLRRIGHPVADLRPMPYVIDVGCGQGWWGAEFERAGCRVLGIDGDYVRDAQIEFLPTDISQPFSMQERAALAVCLEVAEHLPLERAAGFVADLCRLSDVVLFSAAIPWQTGAGHINLQWPTWWAALFAEHGYGCDDSLRFELWNDQRVEPWYRQNLLVFEFGEVQHRAVPLDVVHPEIHAWGRT